MKTEKENNGNKLIRIQFEHATTMLRGGVYILVCNGATSFLSPHNMQYYTYNVLHTQLYHRLFIHT